MRVAVISDIHANAHALAAVLADVDAAAPDAVWCLGDLVGYGPRPNDCVRIVRDRADVCLVGNHDLGVLGRIDLDDFTPDAAQSARWTAAALEPDLRGFLESLQPAADLDRAELFHASARDPVWEYVLGEEAAWASLQATTAGVVLVGHSHVPLALMLGDGGVSGGIAPGGATVDLRAERWLLNPGSVGQPRDGDRRAAWLLVDFGTGRAEWRRVEYDVEATQREIREAGLPESLASRLSAGV